MSGLQHLLEQATPGPWIMRPTSLGDWKIQSPAGGRITPHIGARGHYNMSDAALIALAPDMARLLIDMADSIRLRTYRYHSGSGHLGDIANCQYERCKEATSLMSRFAELDRRAADASR